MKKCPQCQQECADEVVVCPKCGYLFNASQTSDGMQTPPYQPQATNMGGTPPYGNAYNGYPPLEQPKDSFATPSLVLGIIGVVLSCCSIGIIPGIIGLILGILSALRIRRTNMRGRGLAIAGIILSAIAIVIATIAIVKIILLVSNPAAYQEFWNQYHHALAQYQS